MISEAVFEQRLEEWARWTIGPTGMPGLGYSLVCPTFKEGVKTKGLPTPSCDRELQVEEAVLALAVRDRMAAEVIRAEYRAKPAYGDARFECPGNASSKTFRQLGIGERTFYNKLAIAKAAIWTAIYTRK